MNHHRKFAALAALLLLPALIFPASGAETVYVCPLEDLPEQWMTYELRSESQQFLLDMTMEPLAGLTPEIKDVTAEYAADPLVPDGAVRGYAFAIDLAGFWEDGSAVTAADALAGIRLCWQENPEQLLWLANAGAILAGQTRDNGEPVSLEAAGFADLEAAREAGHSRFYLDVAGFWGLDAGWLPIDSTAPLQDTALPSGILEYYVNPSYLYRNYLASGTAYERWQSRFLGVCPEPGEPLTAEDLGLRTEGETRLVLITQEPTAPAFLAAKLAGLYPVKDDLSCGPYRAEAGDGELILCKNQAYPGDRGANYPETIRCQ